MSSTIPNERIFSLSCFEGLRLLQKYMTRYPKLRVQEAIELIEKVESDGKSLDMEASAYLSEFIEVDHLLDGHVFYQTCIKHILLEHQPPWMKLMRQGRKRFIRNLNANERDVFVGAGLMQNPTPLDVVVWWDDVSGYARLFSDQDKMMQGRKAEILTLEHERKRLKVIGITMEPKWPGLDDNFAGYDVLSYDKNNGKIANRPIEVKSTVTSPLRFIITRNEWNKAFEAVGTYIFHIWDMKQDNPSLHVRTVKDIEPHIPTDKGKGIWKNAEIPIL